MKEYESLHSQLRTQIVIKSIDEMNKYHDESSAESLAEKRRVYFVSTPSTRDVTYQQFKARMTSKQNKPTLPINWQE